MIDKQLIAESFGKAASTYDAAARLQRQVGAELLRNMATEQPVQRCLDLGCGTGFFTSALQRRFPEAEIFALDLAEGMLRYARAQADANESGGRTVHWLGGDAEQLPLADASLDLVFSSLALQWCNDLTLAFAELQRVLRPGGCALISTLVDGTLWELRQAWQQADRYQHVNRFLNPEQIAQAAESAGFRRFELTPQQLVLHYRDLRQLTNELKQLGAHNLNAERPHGMTGRQRLMALKQAYEQYREPSGELPATWQLLYIQLHKSA